LLKIEETFDELGLLATSDALDASHQTQTRGIIIDSFCIRVAFEAVHDEIDWWCFLAAISKFFTKTHIKISMASSILCFEMLWV